MQTSAGILFGNRDYKTEICFGQLVFRILIAFCHFLCQGDFLFGGQQLDLTDFFQIHTDRIVQIVLCSQTHRVYQFFFLHIVEVDILVITVIQGSCIVIQFQLGTHQLNVHCLQLVINLLDSLGSQVQMLQLGIEIGHADHAVLLTLGDQFLQRSLHFFQIFRRFFSCTHNVIPLYFLNHFHCAVRLYPDSCILTRVLGKIISK